MLIQICRRCDKRSCGGKNLPPCIGVMLCTVSGKNAREHADANDCPLNRFDQSYAPETSTPPKPITEWPWLARAVAKLKTADDKGLGDTIHRNLARFGADAMSRLYKKITGHDCGCGDRQAKLNRMFPYSL